MTIEELVQANQGILDGAEGRDLTDDELTAFKANESAIESARRSDEARARQRAYTTAGTGLQVIVDASPDTEDAGFDAYLRTGVANADLMQAAQSEGTPSAGGYTVPDGFRQKMVDRMVAYGGIAKDVETITTEAGNPLEWPTIDDTANTGEIVAEGGTFAAGADLVFGTATLGAYKYMAGGASSLPLKVSVELLQDSAFDVRSLVANKLGERIARIQSTHWVTGNGVGQPKGLIDGLTGIEIAADTAGITYADLVTFVHSIDPSYRANARWAFNDTTLAYIRKLEDDNGRPLWLPHEASNIGSPLPGGSLLGFPVTIDQAFPDLVVADNTVNWGAFGDFREGYVIRRVKDITLVVLNELYMPNGQIGFMAWARADGVPQNPNAYVALTGEQ